MNKAGTGKTRKKPTKKDLQGRKLDIIKGYQPNKLRTPTKRLVKLPPTMWQTIGPYFPYKYLLRPGENDLTRIAKGQPRAKGDIIDVVGRVRDQDGRPVQGALIELWQANKDGRYRHPVDGSGLPSIRTSSAPAGRSPMPKGNTAFTASSQDRIRCPATTTGIGRRTSIFRSMRREYSTA